MGVTVRQRLRLPIPVEHDDLRAQNMSAASSKAATPVAPGRGVEEHREMARRPRIRRLGPRASAHRHLGFADDANDLSPSGAHDLRPGEQGSNVDVVLGASTIERAATETVHLGGPPKAPSTSPEDRARARYRLLATGAVVFIGVGAMVALLISQPWSNQLETASTLPIPTTVPDPDVDTERSLAPTVGEPAAPVLDRTAPATIEVVRTRDGLLLTGRVSSLAEADRVEQAFESQFGSFTSSELVVDDATTPVIGLERLEQISPLTHLLVEGSVTLETGELSVAGAVAIDATAAEQQLRSAAEVDAFTLTPTSKRPGTATVEAHDGRLTIMGEVPTNPARGLLVEQASAAGAEVVDLLTITNDVYWPLRLDSGAWLDALADYDTYEITLQADSIRLMIVVGDMLQPGLTELGPELSSTLAAIGMASQRYDSPAIDIVAYSDDLGSPEQSHDITHVWGDLAADGLVATGSDPGVVNVFGRGDSEPLDPSLAHSSTDNRRLEITISVGS